uniref:Uncharacterized protein n=1 Tax=Anguilla anguilla TaxID=7936 RepID=A0A0E9XTW9_ANGAN
MQIQERVITSKTFYPAIFCHYYTQCYINVLIIKSTLTHL